MLETERSYVKDLESAVQCFLIPMRRDPDQVPPPLLAHTDVLFGNVEEILAFHKSIFLKVSADKSAENTPNAPKIFRPICLPKPKSLRFSKKSSLWVSVFRGCAVSATTIGTRLIFTKKSDIAKSFFIYIFHQEMAQWLQKS